MKKVRDEMGLTNLKIMVPFCRTVEEGRRVLAEMARHGLVRGEGGLEVYVMCEIPSNVILADEFAEIFDGFSIGSTTSRNSHSASIGIRRSLPRSLMSGIRR
jgi:pyruvate,water dikinase